MFSKILFALTSAGLLLAGCSKEAPAPAAPAPLPVETVVAESTDEPRWIEQLGQAESGQGVEVRAQVGGILTELHYREGEAVKAGDVLFTIDEAPYRARLNAAASARRKAEVDLSQAERELRRTAALFKSGAASAKERDDALSGRDQAKSLLAEAEATEKDAAINLEWTKVRAPASGVAARSVLNPGALVTASTTLLTTITQLDRVRVSFAPSDRDLKGANVTLENRVVLLNADGTETPVALDYVAQEIDPALGTRLMRVRLPETSRVLPGEFVRVRLMVDTDRNVFRIPQKAVVQLPDGSYAVYVAENGKAVQRVVTVGLWSGSDWIVRTGLKPGDRVITNQLLKLQDGAAVRLANAEGAETEARPE